MVSASSNLTPVSDEDDPAYPRSQIGTPVWEAAALFPLQGHWDDDEYLSLDTNHLVEFADGFVEFLPMPTYAHQLLLLDLSDRLRNYQRAASRRVLVAPYRVKLRPGKYREPDVLYVGPNRKIHARYSEGADLVIEILSQSRKDRERDLVQKRAEYAAAGIPEYWIVDPETTTITVLTLDGAEYRVHGEFKTGDTATSVLLPGFGVNVADCFAAAAE